MECLQSLSYLYFQTEKKSQVIQILVHYIMVFIFCCRLTTWESAGWSVKIPTADSEVLRVHAPGSTDHWSLQTTPVMRSLDLLTRLVQVQLDQLT